MEQLKVLNEQEVLGKQFRVYGTPESPLFMAKDVAAWIDYSKDGKGNYNVSAMISSIDEDEKQKIFTNLNNNEVGSNTWFLTEDGLYEVLMQSRKPIAKQFKKKVKNILKTIRQTGGYVANDDLFIETYFPDMDKEAKTMFKTTLSTLREKNEIIKVQRKEIEHKEDVIIGLVDDISLAEKRQILNRVVRYNHANYRDRWALLYREFENKYHIDLQKRLDNYNKNNKPKCKNKLDYIDRVMHKIPELYEIAVKLFENDVKALVEEMYQAVAV